jgi:hypothetical protein
MTEAPDNTLAEYAEMAEISEDPIIECSNIDYFDQGFERVEGGETSSAIWRQYSR